MYLKNSNFVVLLAQPWWWDMDGIKEKLRNDKEFLDNTKSAMAFLEERMQILSELSEQTVATCEGIPEFESVMLDMKSINAASAKEKAGESLDRIANGGEAPEYEIYSNQAFAGYSKVEKQVNVGRRFYEMASTDGNEKKNTSNFRIITSFENTGSFSTTKMDGIIGRIIKAVISRDEDVASNTFSVDDAFPGIGGLNDLS